MNGAGVPVVRDLVLIGGGHAHVTVLKRFGMQPIPGVRLTLISPDAHTPYSGMLPGLIAGHYTYDEAHIDLMPLCRFAGARFIPVAVSSVDPEAKCVHLPGRPPIPYDILSINAGSTPDPVVMPGAKGRVLPVKPVAEFLELWSALKQRVLANPDCRIGAVGAGAGGVELVLSAQYAIRALLAGLDREPEFHIVTKGEEILATHNAGVRAAFRRILDERGIRLQTGFAVDRVGDDGLHAGAKTLALDEILWVTGADAAPWIRASGFDVDARGFLAVDPTLRSTSHHDVFAAGDAASVVGYPRPKSGVFAVRQGPPLEANLRRALLGRPLRAFRPQSAFLSLVSTGGRHAVASRGRWSLSGDWVWRWKDHIDRSFMDKFNTLPDMPEGGRRSGADRLPAELDTPEVRASLGPLAMRCGGCGAKVGAGTLAHGLAGLPVIRRDDIIAGLDAPDDAAIIAPPAGRLLVQTVDFFRAMIDDPFTFGQIAANHCLGDIYAMGGEPHSAMAVVTLPVALPDKTEADFRQMMAGAMQVLEAANCALVGGHTGEAAETSLGFAVTGLVTPGAALQKSGVRPGDAVILTKPIGSGTLFAAEMRGKAKGRWVQAALANALVSNAAAAAVLRQAGATACTDVTGFGLAGHLHEMLVASGCAAELDLPAVALLEGAVETIGAGIVSSLHSDNERLGEHISAGDTPPSDPRFQLLFDPQTAGGLLAAVPSADAVACIEALRAAGYTGAAIIAHARPRGHQDAHVITVRDRPVT